MLQESAKELLAGESHRALLVVIRIVLPTESNLGIGDGENPMVGNGDAMRVTSEVLQDVLWPAKRWFGIDDPILLKQRSQKSIEVAFLGQRQTFTKES